MKKVKIGIIGAGEIAQNFHLPILKAIPNVSIVGICDRLFSKATMIAEKFGIEKVYRTIHELLAVEDLDGVFILTPTDLHLEFSLAAIEAGKNIFIEKPIARNTEEAIIIRDAAAAKKVKVMIGMSQRFRHDARVLKTYISNRELGNIFYIKSGWLQRKHKQGWKDDMEKSGGGVLMELGLSLIDSMLWMFNFPKVKSVSANNFTRTMSDMEDISVGTIKFQDGAVATFECSWSLYTKVTNFFFNVYGEDGSAVINPLQLFKKNGDLLQPQSNEDKIGNLHIHQKSYETELKHFINSIAGLSPIISTPEEAVEAMRILDTLYESAKVGKEIFLD